MANPPGRQADVNALPPTQPDGEKPRLLVAGRGVFEDPRSLALLGRMRQLAPSDATVLITGETGTGKEIVAQNIHELSLRANRQFVVVNCGAFSETLIESDLFGHERGAFTGAATAKAGWFEAADGGTLFLDEIGELPLSAQSKLLRVLQEREVVRLGSRNPIPVDIRLIAATNVHLEEAVASGKFREDLYFRLAVAKLTVEPLRNRPGDVLPLARHFIDAYARRLAWRGGAVPSLTRESERCLLSHPWAGNIRELENAIQHALLVCSENEIRPEDLALLSSPVREESLSSVFEPAEPRRAPEPPENAREALRRALLALYAEGAPRLWNMIEELVITTAYQHAKQNQLRTARLLGVSRNVVRARLVQFGVTGRYTKLLDERPPRFLGSARRAIDIWYSRAGSATASSLAVRKKWLESELRREGIELHSLRSAKDEELRNAHYHHRQTGLFREGGNIPPIWARGNGQPTAVVGITWLDEYQGILTRASSNIRDVHDLRGRRLSIPLVKNNLIDHQRGAALHGFVTALGVAGLRIGDARCVDVPVACLGSFPADVGRRSADAELAALEAGHVDAVFVRGAYGARLARDSRFRQVFNINDHPDPLVRVNNGTPRPITVDRAFLEKHPEVVARYLSILLRAAAWAEKRPKQVLELIASERAGDLSVDDVLASHGPDVHRSFTPQLNWEFIRGLEAQKDFLLEYGFIRADFDVKDWVIREPLGAAESLARDAPELVDESSSAFAT